MFKNASEILKILFAINPEVIARDLRRAEQNLLSIVSEIRGLLAIPLDERTPEGEAQYAHLSMIQAREFCRRDTIAPEEKTFFAAFGAGHIAQGAEMITWDKETCADLSARMDAIRHREGLGRDEFWMKGEEPPDYRELDDELGRVIEGIYDTIFVFALRRYDLNDQANLFERDRVTFEIQREIGRRVIMPVRNDPEVERMMDDAFERSHGQPALARVVARAREIREKKV